MRKALSLFVILMSLSGLAHAGIMIEPYFGYDVGDAKRTTLLGVDEKDAVAGPNFGLRLGYKFLVPWLALDYTMGDQTYQNAGSTDTWKKTALGVVVGADTPIGLRIFGGYGFDEKFRLENGTDYLGTYTKVGLGMSLVPMIALNFEYIMHKIEKRKIGSTEVSMDTLYSKQDYNSIFVSLSVPFNL